MTLCSFQTGQKYMQLNVLPLLPQDGAVLRLDEGVFLEHYIGKVAVAPHFKHIKVTRTKRICRPSYFGRVFCLQNPSTQPADEAWVLVASRIQSQDKITTLPT